MMSITERLGKAGIPGFRSGKWWKMLLAIPVYLFMGMLMLAFVVGVSSPPNKLPATATYDVTTSTTVIATPEKTVASTPTSIPTPITTPEYDDIYFLKWSANLPATGANYLDYIKKAKNLREVGIYGELMRDEYSEYTKQMKQFSISPRYQPIADEFELYLRYMSNAGNSYYIAGEVSEVRYVSVGNDNVEKATKHLENSTTLLRARADQLKKQLEDLERQN